MAVSAGFTDFVLEQLGRAAAGVRAQRMFGGVGIYAGEQFFGIVHDDTLYFKVDDDTCGDYLARGMQPFRPYREKNETMQYYQVPADVLEDAEALRGWVLRAVAVARRAKRTPVRRTQRSQSRASARPAR